MSGLAVALRRFFAGRFLASRQAAVRGGYGVTLVGVPWRHREAGREIEAKGIAAFPVRRQSSIQLPNNPG